jgi:hypothetical protein
MTPEEEKWLQEVEDSVQPGCTPTVPNMAFNIRKLVTQVRELDGMLHGNHNETPQEEV